MGGNLFPLSTTMVMTITAMTTGMYNQECITTWKCDLQCKNWEDYIYVFYNISVIE
jgi:hypothetical protein